MPIKVPDRNERTLRMPDSPNTAVASVESPSSIVTSPLLIPTSASATRESGAAAAPQPPLSNGLHATSPNQPISPGVQLPPTCGARQLSKLKRFLTTLQQFGSDISPEIGERVRGLIVNLVNNAITVEDFHQQLQDTTNFPLRPFVIPFLKANLPLLQQELVNCAHLSKRSPGGGHYMPPPSTEPLSERERERIKTEVEEFGFERPPQPSSTASQAGEKRKPPPQEVETRPKENGHHLDAISSPNNKRKCLTPRFDVEGNAFVDQLMENLKNDTDEWRNVETMLQYISTFVEKAKRSISVLQERCIRDREEMANWARAMAADAENEIKRRTEAVIENNTRTTDERMNEMKRFAEEAVTDVKRQAVVELQKAVNAAEEKANDALNQAQQHKEQALLEARRQAAEEAIMLANQQENSKENCWNCGRKANETCSGCSVARYCGSFCQHKDWDKDHHKECQKYKQQTQQQQQEAKPKTPPQEQQQTAESRREQQQQQAESRRVIEINKSSDVRSTSPRPVIVTSAPIVTQSHTNIAMSEGPVQASSSAS